MTLSEIAHHLGTTQARLRANPKPGGNGSVSSAAIDDRRTFVVMAFGYGHEPEFIAAYIDRTGVMILHALRMGCMDRCGGNYGRSLGELADELRVAA